MSGFNLKLIDASVLWRSVGQIKGRNITCQDVHRYNEKLDFCHKQLCIIE